MTYAITCVVAVLVTSGALFGTYGRHLLGGCPDGCECAAALAMKH